MEKVSSFLPRKWLAESAEIPLKIKTLIVGFEDGETMDASQTFKIVDSGFLFLWLRIHGLKFNFGLYFLPMLLKNTVWQYGILNLIVVLNLIIIVVVHVLEHLLS